MNTIFPPSGLYCDDFAIRFPRAWLLAFLEIQIDQEGLATMATMVDEAAQAVPVAEDAAAQAESAPRESHAEPTSSEKPGAATDNNKGTEGEVGARELSRDYTGRLQTDSNAKHDLAPSLDPILVFLCRPRRRRRRPAGSASS